MECKQYEGSVLLLLLLLPFRLLLFLLSSSLLHPPPPCAPPPLSSLYSSLLYPLSLEQCSIHNNLSLNINWVGVTIRVFYL